MPGVGIAVLAFAGMVPAHAAGILTQGGSFAPPVSASVAASIVGAQQEAALALRSQNELSRISTAMQAMQTMQTAARNLAFAKPSSVPDGLVTGGLVPDSGLGAPGIANPVKTWVGANTPTQATAAGHTNVTINQTAAQAILSWNTFNVGKATTVDFNQQGHANWVALNQISATGMPSQILGSIKADGQVYLINPNGIIFGGSSQVNVGALIASSASISNAQFLASGIYSTQSNQVYSPSFINAGGAVTVQAGAQIATHAPVSVTNGGGFVLLMGTQVSNAGSITTPSGQAELAAGNDFLLRPGYDPVTNATSTTRGNEVGIVLSKNGSSASPGGAGLVANSGVISAATGDITLAGETVTQAGLLDSTTTVAVRGTIHLLSPQNDPLSSVTLTGNSLTVIAPDLASTATALDSQRAAEILNSTVENSNRNSFLDQNFTDLSLLSDRQDESRVEIVTGGMAIFQNGSQTVAQGGQVAVTAGTEFLAQTNALIDVSGVVGVPLPVSANDLAVSIQSFEQRDAPQNRLTQLLRNNTVYVDARTLSAVPASSSYGSTRDYTAGGLLEVSGYLNTTGHTIGEWTSLGGTITVATGATGAIVTQPGSVFNLAGGSVQYQSGYVRQSYLLGMNGQIYNVNNAPAYITYAGVYNGFSDVHTRWGVTQTYSNVLSDPAQIFEQGYTQGRAAGSLQLDAPTTIFAGSIQAGVVNGARQTAAPPAAGGDPYTFGQSAVAVPGGLQISALGNVAALPGSTNVQITNAALPSTTGTGPISGTELGNTFLSAGSLSQAGLGSLFVLTDGAVNLAAPLSLAPGAAISLYGSTVNIAANITAHAGNVTAANYANLGGAGFILQATNPATGTASAGDITLAAGARIDTTGIWTNLFLNPATPSGGAFINGGAVTLLSLTHLNIDTGSMIDASAGAEVAPNGVVTGGAGGALSLTVTSLDPAAPAGYLTLQGSLRSIGFTAGGALSISAPALQIGSAATGNIPDTVLLKPAFFASGFSSYNLNSSDGLFLNVALPASDDVTIAPGTIINVVEPVYQATQASAMTPTGAPVSAGAALVLNPVYVTNPQLTSITQRPGASFSLTAGAITLGGGAAINVDPKQSISLSSTGQITINGSLTAPGGVINISNPLTTPTIPGIINGQTTIVPVLAPVGQLSIFFGATGRVSTAGQAFSAGSIAGNLISIAPAGGEILIGDTAAAGVTGLVPAGAAVIIAQAGAVFDASGSAAFDRQTAKTALNNLAVTVGGGNRLIPVEGAGGSIVLASSGGIYNDATMRAFAGGPNAAGGTLDISLPTDALFGPNAIEDVPRILTITQTGNGPVLSANLAPGMVDPSLVAGTSQISAAQINAGGFGTVSLGAHDAIIFDGNVTLSTAQSIAFYQGALSENQPNDIVVVNAPYVSLSGQQQISAQNGPRTIIDAVNGFSAQQATGSFTVNADAIDVSNAVNFGGIESVNLPSGVPGKIDLADFGTVTLHSLGDLSLSPSAASSNGGSLAETTLISQNNINLIASRIYARSGAQVLVQAGYLVSPQTAPIFNPKKSLIIGRPADAASPAPPYELGGSLTFQSATILDSGVVWQPLGAISFGGSQSSVAFLPGSYTSVSAARLTIPFGGTTDGINYAVDGNNVIATKIAGNFGFGLNIVKNGVQPGTISINALKVRVAQGATLDLSGGGNLTGAGFISGQGGSTDVLSTPLLQLGAKGGVTQPSLGTNPVYAIVAGPQPADTPSQSFTQTGAAASMPAMGAQIIIPAGVPGLPAGTYTLLPAAYALNPGGYRVEFGGAANLAAAPVLALPNGSYAVAGYTAQADTAVRSTSPSALTITPALTVQNYAQYDTQSYSQFLLANAARIGVVRPVLPEDAGILNFLFPADSAATLTNSGLSNFQAASGGVGGTLIVSGVPFILPQATFDIYGAAPTPDLKTGTVSLSAAALDHFNAFTLEIGIAGGNFNADTQGVTLEAGATLSAARVVLTAEAGGVTLKTGSEINTLGRGTLFKDSTTSGFFNSGGVSVLDVGNGYIAYTPSGTTSPFYGPITVQDGATIYTNGSIAFSTGSAVTIGTAANLGGKYLDFALPEINVENVSYAGVTPPPGLTLTQPVLQRLTAGVPALNVPAVQILVLAAGNSLNFFGTTSLDLSGTGVQLVIDSPAIYGFGSVGDVATIKAGTIVWNGISTIDANGNVNGSAAPGGVIGNAPGTGTLNFDAGTILLGYSPLDFAIRDVPLNRLALGFTTVNLNASNEVTANTQGTLAVYQSQPLTYGAPNIGGVLNLNTPLLTGDNQAKISFIAGTAINLGLPVGAKAATTLPTPAAGAEIDLAAGTVSLASAVILPSGKLDINATGDITLRGGSNIDLAGVSSTIINKTVYGFGGTLIAESTAGNITQDAGGVINVAAQGNNAGAVKLTATAAGQGKVLLNGALLGSAAGNFNSGSFDVRAQSLGDFMTLNTALDAGGFFQARSFDIKQGDLTIGNGVKAHQVTISVDGGSLTVTGLIDASGNGAGSITLAAANNLTLDSGAVLDAHGTVLQVDQYNQAIAAANAPVVNLTATSGTLTLTSGATIDLASADHVARGDLELNVPRLGGVTAGDANISAQTGLNITGAATIAVNAFATYNGVLDTSKTTIDGAPNAFITQAYLDGINNSDTVPFMNAAQTNADLASRLAGLKSTYGGVFHFRPGVEIVSAPNGDLTVQGDIDLSGYRYGPGVNPKIYGSGEPAVLVLRAADNLNIYGSITDGFGKPVSDVGTTFANGWTLLGGSEPYGQNIVVPVAVTLAAGTTLQAGPQGVNYQTPLVGGPFQPNAVAPVALMVSGNQVTPSAFIATSNITLNGTVLYQKGALVPAGITLQNNTVIAAGGSFPFYVTVGNVLWPANTPFTIGFDFGFGTTVTLSQNLPLLPGSVIPGNGGTNILLPNFANSVNTRPSVGKTQGQIYPLGQLLPAGDLSWSIQLVGGADLSAADPGIVQPAGTLGAQGNAGDIILSDTHYETSAFNPIPVFSVVRTGTGSLALNAGGSITEISDYGIYTAGAQAPAILDTTGANPYNLPQGLQASGNSLLGSGNKKDTALAANYQANYPTGGGNVLIDAQGNLNGFINTNSGNVFLEDSDAIGSWLWRQGGAGQPGAWWVEFGALEPSTNYSGTVVQMDGFQGIGTLGGGNLTVNAGGNASGLNLAVASTGRVLPDGKVAQTGGGNLTLNVGGAINFVSPKPFGGLVGDAGGVITDLLGNISLNAGSIGVIQPFIGQQPNDPRVLPPLASQNALTQSAIDLAPGDGTVTVTTRGDQVINSVVNPGTVQNQVNSTPVDFSNGGQTINVKSGGATLFSLWSANTSVGLVSAGGDVVPNNSGITNYATPQNASPDHVAVLPVSYYPPSLSVVSQNGNIDFVGGRSELAPSPAGSLQLLAANSILGGGTIVAMSGAPGATLATPLNPSITVSRNGGNLYSNASPSQSSALFAFGPDTPTGNLHAKGQPPATVYAGSGDIIDLQLGTILFTTPNGPPITQYVGAMPFDVVAGRDIINLGTVASPDLFLNLSPTDVTSITAGRDILQSSADIAGPGTLLLQAGRNVYQADQGVLTSVGPVFNIDPNNRNDGAGIVVIAGVGTAGPDYANFENLYLNPDSKLTLQNASQIISANDAQLYAYLHADYAYAGPPSGAYAYFMQHLTPIQRDVYLLNVYYAELNSSGLEYNNPASVRYRSYLRGKDAIAALFPGYGTVPGSPDTGDITLFGNSGIQTQFGGAIQTLTPGGQTIVGVEGTTPSSSAGFVTQGSGNIDIYAQDSVLLGQSRVLTTFGGNILIWSATGDINAGRGNKTTIDFTPLQRVYDPYGNVSLSPTVPSSGAGIGTLNPIPQVVAGNINLVAPLGTVDAGEAGVRVSGNLNVAALHVVNGGNFATQGTSTGVPVSASPNVGALSAASNASGAAAAAAENTGTHAPSNQPTVWIVEVLGYGGGDAGPPPAPSKKKKNPTTQASLASFGGQA